MAAVAEIGGFMALRMAAPALRPSHPAPVAATAPPQPRRAVAARSVRTSTSEKVADLAVGTNGSPSAPVSGAFLPVRLPVLILPIRLVIWLDESERLVSGFDAVRSSV